VTKYKSKNIAKIVLIFKVILFDFLTEEWNEWNSIELRNGNSDQLTIRWQTIETRVRNVK